MTALTSPRLELIPATVELIDAELAGDLAPALGVDVPGDWPPEHHDRGFLDVVRAGLQDPAGAGWWLYYGVLVDAVRPTLVGSTGYVGPPRDGSVEIGYSIVASQRRRGLATEGVGLLIESAWERGATAVLAHTLPGAEPSIGVLRKHGFSPSETAREGVVAFTLRR